LVFDESNLGPTSELDPAVAKLGWAPAKRYLARQLQNVI